MTRGEKIRYAEALNERLLRDSRSDLYRFTFATMPSFRPAGFHRHYYKALTRFAEGDVRKMMIFMPPQHGKSEGSTRRLPAFLLGRDPDTKIAVACYNAPKARKFNREIRRIMDSEQYHAIFPDTRLPASMYSQARGEWVRNANEFEVVGRQGGVKTIGVGGALTGEPVDVLIMDDLYKDAKSAWSLSVRNAVSDWYDTVADTRLHNGSRQLIVFTRWHQEDLAGRLLKQDGVFDGETNKSGWVVLKFQAIKEGAPSEFDPREEGEALWPERHSLEKLMEARRRNRQVFDSLYQGDPQPVEGLMYESGFSEYYARPASARYKRKAYVDTADTGQDFLCMIIYDETETANYVVDVLYTQRAMEYTEPECARRLTKFSVEECVVESNNGGRGFGRNVQTQCRLMGNDRTMFVSFTQTASKDARIYTNSASVQNLVVMPQGWRTLFPAFSNAVCNYMKTGKNEHDDAPDALTGTVERRRNNTEVDVAGLFGR